MTDKEYILDRMTVGNPKIEKIDTSVVRCVILEEIVRESLTDVKYEFIESLSRKDSSDDDILSLQQVVPDLIDAQILNISEGCGDARIVAYCIARTHTKQQSLLPVDATVVSDDKKLVNFLKKNNFNTMTSQDFFGTFIDN